MSTVPGISRKPLRILEVPINKIGEDVIPYYQCNLEEYKVSFRKLIATDVARLKHEVNNKKNTVRKLRDLFNELDTLRAQAESEDLDAFDEKTLPLRKIILGLLSEYQELENTAAAVIKSHHQEETPPENINPLEGAQRLQVQETVEELKLKEKENVLHEVQKLEEDVQDLQGMYSQLHQMVDEQKENVNAVETNIETTKVNVDSGMKQLLKASRLKSAAYPITGAMFGGMLGGPVGMLAGIKVGLAATLGLGVIGYSVGKYTKKMAFIVNRNVSEQDNQESVTETLDNQQISLAAKKDT